MNRKFLKKGAKVKKNALIAKKETCNLFKILNDTKNSEEEKLVGSYLHAKINDITKKNCKHRHSINFNTGTMSMSLANEIMQEVIVANGAHVKNEIETINEKCTNTIAVLFSQYCKSCMNIPRNLEAIYYGIEKLEIEHCKLVEHLD